MTKYTTVIYDGMNEHDTGYGLFGLPEDYTSPSRFIRSFYLKNRLDDFDTNEGINRLYSIFRPIIVPRSLEHKKAEMSITDYTRYWSGYDVTKQIAYAQIGEGLAITAKELDTSMTDITYHTIHLDNNIVFASYIKKTAQLIHYFFFNYV
ncbi:linear amide C-N hydrolase [Vagococcus sp. CY52-2]|uniref:linear amide C-N hydrolase n=1 Tax=Vagococcus sp. CY52-2 TaxID=2925838 RepID=UPI001F57B803|nr:linear amide C-N hydrolase [Vagococcus sp. CY52-2]UNM89599.1 linear amide C-N hydrolase [Vagococcus sp. CY52-2]